MSGLLFIRHAETDMAGRFCGQSDPPVNARGQQQIVELIESIKSEPIEAVYCSDLARAVTTAHAIADALSARFIKKNSLREISFGEWEGRDPAYAHRWIEAFPNLPAPGGEVFAEFQARVLTEVAGLMHLAKKTRIAVVTHAGVMRVVLQSLNHWTSEAAWNHTKDFCSSFTLESDATLQEARQ